MNDDDMISIEKLKELVSAVEDNVIDFNDNPTYKLSVASRKILQEMKKEVQNLRNAFQNAIKNKLDKTLDSKESNDSVESTTDNSE